MSKISEFVGLHSLPPKNDWVSFGKKNYNWVYPPKIIKEEVSTFKSELKIICNHKIEEIIKRQTVLDKEFNVRVKYLAKNEFSESLSLLFENISIAWYAEYFLLDEWLVYWSKIYDIIEPENKIISSNNKELEFKEKIQRAKEVSIQSLYKGDLRTSGSRLKGTCPFHEEKTASFFIFSDNSWWCFGCNEGGDSINFIMKLENIGFVEAIEKLLWI